MTTPPIDILLVDDEKGYVDVLANRLARRSVRAAKAFNGPQAIQTLRHRDFHAVILDLKMEKMDGMEVLGIIKRMAPDLPVILLTGHGSTQAAKEGMAQGAFDCLTKPCDLSVLMEKIKAAAALCPPIHPKEIP